MEQLKRDVTRDIKHDVNKMRNALRRDVEQLQRGVKRDISGIRNTLQKDVEQFKRDITREFTELRDMLHTDVGRIKRDVVELREMSKAVVGASTASHNITYSGIVFPLHVPPGASMYFVKMCSLPTVT